MLLDLQNNLQKSDIVYSVSSHLCETVNGLLHKSKGMGSFNNIWKAFQYELALEKLFFGCPICASSRLYSISLGVNSTHDDSLSKRRGFLGLSPVGNASVGTIPPPLNMWIKDESQQARVLRVFLVTECVHLSPQVIGEALILVLLGDLCQCNDRLPVQMLQLSEAPIGKLVDYRSVGDFARQLVNRKSFGYPNNFGRALQIVWC